MKAITEFDRQREKLHALGAGELNNTELLAILLGTGSSEFSVLDLCGKIMRSVQDEAAGLLKLSAEELCGFQSVGLAKAATILD